MRPFALYMTFQADGDKRCVTVNSHATRRQALRNLREYNRARRAMTQAVGPIANFSHPRRFVYKLIIDRQITRIT